MGIRRVEKICCAVCLMMTSVAASSQGNDFKKMKNDAVIPNPAKQFRIARPTDKLEAVSEFYVKGLGLMEIERFENHSGYDGIIIGLPDNQHHLEFTRHINGSPCPAPSKDNLLVMYFENANQVNAIVSRLNTLNYHEVEPENPYWKGKSVTFEDPDGWRVVLFEAEYGK